MDVWVNGEAKALEDGCTLGDLIVQMDLVDKRIAVEVNENIIPRSEHSSYSLEAGSKIEIVHAIGGG